MSAFTSQDEKEQTLAMAKESFDERGWNFFRSEKMAKVSLTIPGNDRQLQIEVVRAIGDAAICQFEDAQGDAVALTQRQFKSDVYAAYDCERMMRTMKHECMRVQEDPAYKQSGKWPEGAFFYVNEMENGDAGALIRPQGNDVKLEPEEFDMKRAELGWTGLEELREQLQSWTNEISDFNSKMTKLKEQRMDQEMTRITLEAANNFLSEMDQADRDIDEASAAVQTRGVSGSVSDGMDGVRLQSYDEAPAMDSTMSIINFVTGVIDTEQLHRLNKMVYTSLRGLYSMKYDDVEDEEGIFMDPTTDMPRKKSTFIIFFQGEMSKNKVLKLCQNFSAKIIDNDLVKPPASACEGKKPSDVRQEKIQEAISEIANHEKAIAYTLDFKRKTLVKFYRYAQEMSSYVYQEKMIFFTLNKFVFSESAGGLTMAVEGWCPAAAIDGVEGSDGPMSYLQALVEMAKKKAHALDAPVLVRKLELEEDNSIHSHAEKPPTLIRVNNFTSGFQGIVDGYGIPRYEEVNPGFFAIAMFPFLFGVMFGDIFHGAMMVVLGIYLVCTEDAVLKTYNQQNEIFLMVFDGRWTVIMCGICATYMGFIYNEGLSVAFDWFGSGYKLDHFPQPSFGSDKGVTVNCLSGSSMGHGLYGPMGNASCLIGSMVVSSFQFANHTNKFLPTTLFKGSEFSTNSNGATFPSLWCSGAS
jgi:vacuolar-type H+-ATPase subunit I/STV1